MFSPKVTKQSQASNSNNPIQSHDTSPLSSIFYPTAEGQLDNHNLPDNIALHLVKAKMDLKKYLLSSSHQKYWCRALNEGKCRVSLYTHCNLSYGKPKKLTQEIAGWSKAKRLALLGADRLMIFLSVLYIHWTFLKFPKVHVTGKIRKRKKKLFQSLFLKCPLFPPLKTWK